MITGFLGSLTATNSHETPPKEVIDQNLNEKELAELLAGTYENLLYEARKYSYCIYSQELGSTS